MRIKTYEEYIADLLVHQDIQRLKETTDHHGKRDRLTHTYAVGKLAYRMATIFHANVNVAARSGFLHDWYHGHKPDRKYFINADNKHSKISHQAAQDYGEHPRILHAIRAHFWPYSGVLPRTREAWIVWSADILVWFADWWQSLKISVRDRSHPTPIQPS